MLRPIWEAKFNLSRIAYDVLIISIGPTLLVLFPALPFANNGNCDPWYVYGLYFNLPDQVHWSPHARQVGRLTETLPGYVLTHTLPGIVSDYALFLLFFMPAVFLLYKTAALLFSSERAVLSAVFFALSPIVIGNYAVTFNGPSVTYEIIALYCAVRAMISAGPNQIFGWMFLSGVALGAGLLAHLGVLIFSVFIYWLFALSIIFDLDLSIRARIGRLAIGASAALCGLLALTSALSTFAAAAWGDQYWSIILNQIEYISDALENNATLYWQSDWYRGGPNIGMYILGFGAAFIGIMMRRPFHRTIRQTSPSGRREFAISISFVITLIVLFVDELLHGIFLQYDYYFVLLWPFLSLTIFAIGNVGASTRFPFGLFFFYAVCLIGVTIKQYDMPDWVYDWRLSETIVLATVSIVLLLALRLTGRTLFFVCYLFVVALSTVLVRPDAMGIQLWQRPNRDEWRDSYARLNFGLKFLARTFGNPDIGFDVPKFWVDRENVSDGLYYPRSYLSCGSHPFPNIDPERWARSGRDFRPGDIIVIIARPPNVFDRARAALDSLNLEPTELVSTTIVDEDGPYDILVVRVNGTRLQ
jgi:hypothetical protein